jgi:hypothetical protein
LSFVSSDLTGKQLGPWLVGRVVEESNRNRKFECKCVECGAVVLRWGSSLIQRHPSTGHADGCSHVRRWQHPVGQRHGMLLIVRELERGGRRERERKFECQCDCGKTVVKGMPYFYGTYSSPLSCGCARQRTRLREQYRVTEDGRICLECLTWKPWVEYKKTKAGPFGYTARCKGCQRWYYVEYYYHITKLEWEWLLARQGGACALCGQEETNPRTAFYSVDHDHTCCGKKFACKKCIRGLLCDLCNSRLLPIVDRSERLKVRFVDYLDGRPFLGGQLTPLS